MNEIKERVARGLLAIGAVFLRPEEPFTWASGIKSPIYCDNRLILTAPDVRGVVEAAIAETVAREFPEAEVLMGTGHGGHSPRRHRGASHGPAHGLRPLRREGPRQAKPHRGQAPRG